MIIADYRQGGGNRFDAFLVLHHRHGNNLDGNDEADHGDGVDGGVCHAGDVAVHHGVGGSQAGGGGHATGDGAKEVEHGDLEYQSAYQSCNKHGNQCDGCTDAEEQETACLESGDKSLAGRCAYFSKEQKQTQLAEQLV